MEYLNNKLCLEYDEFVPNIMCKNTYDRYKQRGTITVHGLGGNGRKVLIEYETLPEKYRVAVVAKYGDPYEHVTKQPLLDAVKWDNEAEKYYLEYVLPNGDKLPSSPISEEGKKQIDYVHRYTQAASWLNMLIRLTSDKVALKRELNLTLEKFWQATTEVIKVENVNLPGNPKRLKEKIRIYKDGGYEVLVEAHKFGNDFSKKIDEDGEALLKGLLSARNKHDDTVIADAYNQWASENDKKTIVPGTVAYWRDKWANMLVFEREGAGATYTKLSTRIKRSRPSAPLLLVNSDDNVLDLYFRAEGNNWFRPVMYVVIDAFNDYILGYAVGANVTVELIKDAYRNAMRHVMELTGDSYLMHQIQTDRWGISGKNTTDLEKFYSSMSTFTPAGLKNSQSKYIERTFGTEWHQELKRLFPNNYSGHNVRAKERLNNDKLVPANFPSAENMHAMVAAFVERMRLKARKGMEVSRQEEWVKAFKESTKSQSLLINTEKRLLTFGKVHEWTNTITADGVTPTLEGMTIQYPMRQSELLKHNGKTVQVVYDPYDLSEVLITDHKGLRMVLQSADHVPAAIADYKPGDRERINNLIEDKKTLLPAISEWSEDWKEKLNRMSIDAESRLLAGVMLKEQNHKDQRVLTEKQAQLPARRKNDGEINIYDLM